MGSLFGKLPKEDLEFLKIHTDCDEKTIKTVYNEFKEFKKKI